MARHIRSATVGDWRHHLDDRHLRALLDHADVIRASGYDVLAPGER